MGGRDQARRPQVGARPLTDPLPDPPGPERRIVRVAVDVPALADQGRELDYVVPPNLAGGIDVGTVVRAPLHGRRVGGWVVAVDVEPPPGISLLPLAKVTGVGPAPDLVELSAWAGWRWAGRRTSMLRTATARHAIGGLPRARVWAAPRLVHGPHPLTRDALAAGEAVVRLAPATDPFAILESVCAEGPALIVCPAVDQARSIAARLRRAGAPVAVVPDDWASAAAGGTAVVGARAAAWGPAPSAAAIVVVDSQDRALVEERAPAWSAWVVCAERARRAGIPCVLVSPCPTLAQLRWGQLITAPRVDEREGWPIIEVVDRRKDDPRTGLLGERLVEPLRSATRQRRTVCVLNRKGRARLLACRTCGAVTVCEHCGGPAEQTAEGLTCRRCGRSRPAVCQACGSTALKALRVGTSRVTEEAAALARLPAAEVTAEVTGLPDAPVLVGTEAVLHRLAAPVAAGELTVGAVVFLDFDAELLAPRFAAAEDALALLARAARLVGGRRGGRLIVQTRQPDHPVIQAAVRSDPGRLAATELPVRVALGLPPAVAMAELSGADEPVSALGRALGERDGISVAFSTPGRALVVAHDHRTLCDALAASGRPVAGRLRVEVDPLDV